MHNFKILTGDRPRRRLHFLDRERSIAPEGFNRWLIPPAALAVHLAIGEVYAFSVFNIPLSRLIGIRQSVEGDWNSIEIGRIFSIAIVFLGLSAALFGQWLERVGPRKAMFTAAVCFGSGFLISAVGVWLHLLWVVYLGYGVIGGIGLGLGYISPVSTLIKWFPDRPGMATGMAIMGFGGGGIVGSPFAARLMDQFKTPLSVGVAETFAVLGVVSLLFMLFGAFTVRLPPPGWSPGGRAGARIALNAPISTVTPATAIATPQFWLLWAVLFLNVTAGIGIIAQASPMIQEMFPEQVTVAAATGFVGLVSLFNMVGRIFWASLSDRLGRKPTYAVFFFLGACLYALIPQTRNVGGVPLFVAASLIIMSMYGGGFATIPAYLRDCFGVAYVGAIHGRLLTAWSLAGIAGPELVSRIREYAIAHGAPRVEAYTTTMNLMAGLLVIGFVCNMFIRPTNPRYFTQLDKSPTGPRDNPKTASVTHETTPVQGFGLGHLVRWGWVAVPLGWGVWQTIQKSLALFS